MVAKKTDKLRFKCFNCQKILLAPESLLEKTTKCPGCQAKLTPKDNLVQERKEFQKEISSTVPEQPIRIPVQKEKKKSNFKGLIILNLLLIPLILIPIFYEKEVKFDKSLLQPVIEVNQSNEDIKQLNELELKAVTASFTDPTLLPTGGQIPEFTPDQSRPTRYYLGQCVKNANKLLAGKSIKELKIKGSKYFDPTKDLEFEILNQAFAKSKNPIYLEAIFDRFLKEEKPNTKKVTQVLSSLAIQKSILKETSSDKYIQSIAKIKNLLDTNIQNAKSPIQAIDLLNTAMLLPKGLNQTKAIQKAKPILEDAFNHINKTRTDGLFLSPEESTEFSLKIIQLSWQYYLEKTKMPEWLYQLAEKESCRLAYRLEPDGCLPTWEKDKPRINLSQHIYKASKVFDRDDLRFIAHGGRRAKNAYPPEQKDFHFPEIGIYIRYSNWKINHFKDHTKFRRLPFHDKVVRFVFNEINQKISLYYGSTSIGIFKIKNKERNKLEKINKDMIELMVDNNLIGIFISSKLTLNISKIGNFFISDKNNNYKYYDRRKYNGQFYVTKYVPNINILEKDGKSSIVIKLNIASEGAKK